MCTHGMVLSSLGDIDSFSEPALKSFKHGASGGRTVAVTDVLHSVRLTVPFVLVTYYQFAGCLQFDIHASGKYYTAEEMDAYETVCKRWLEKLAISETLT
jgi:hypothetical protein